MQPKAIDKFKKNTAAVLNIVCMTVLFFSAWGWYYSRKTVVPVDFGGHILVLAVFATIYMLCFFLYGTFRISITHTPELFLNQLLSLAITNGIMYILIMLLCAEAVTVLPLAVSLVGQACIALLWSVVTRKWYFATHPPKKTIIIWDVRKGLDKLINMYGVEDRYQVVSVVHIKECIHDLHSHLNGMDAVFLSGIHSRDRNKIIKYCVNNNIDAYVIPRVGDMIISGAKPIYLFNLPVLKLERYCPNIAFIIIKRLGDILVSGLALIVLSPLMLIVAILIKKTDGGTVFYKQKRLTVDGKVFEILKFRSMRMDAEQDGIARLSTGTADDRITPIGRIIRKIRFDELPQLINVLKGEMAIVGPRPERPEIAAEYEAEMPEFHLRLQAKAGLTGYAQVYGRYNTTPYDKLLMDLVYIAHPSLARDLMICMATIKILFMPESTAGIAKGSITAMESAIHDQSESENI